VVFRSGVAFAVSWCRSWQGCTVASLLVPVIRDDDELDAILDALGRLPLPDQVLLDLGTASCIVLPYGLVVPGSGPSGVTTIVGHLVGYTGGFPGACCIDLGRPCEGENECCNLVVCSWTSGT